MNDPVQCRGCGKELGLEPSGSIADQANALNAVPVMSHSAGTYYVCVPCGSELCGLARQMRDILKDDQFYFAGFVRYYPVDGDPLSRKAT